MVFFLLTLLLLMMMITLLLLFSLGVMFLFHDYDLDTIVTRCPSK